MIYELLNCLQYAVGVLFLLPLIIVFGFMYGTIFYLKWFKTRNLKPGQQDNFEFYEKARRRLDFLWKKAYHIWYNMEVEGFEENFPKAGPTIALFFHGSIPVDVYFFTNYLSDKKLEYGFAGVTDHFMFKFPWYSYFSKAYNTTEGSLETCVEMLNERKTLILAPGGAYEGQCGDHNYKIMWRKRLGFARLAIQTNAKIVPIFTENLQESFRPIGVFKSFWEKLYLKTRLPLVPMWGGWPVKLTIHIGEPIQAESGMEPEDLKNEVIEKLEGMIRRHQRIPGSILMALVDRLTSMF